MPVCSRTIRPFPLLVAGVAGLSLASFASSALAATLCVNPNGKLGCKATIGAAVAAASPGDVIQVWPGVYDEQVTISKSLSLMSTVPLAAVIDATNSANGIWVDGMSAAPNPGVANVVISGFKIRNANYEGVLLTNATNVTLIENEVMDNDRSLDSAGGTCPGINTAFETNEQDDCGEGVHLMGVDHSTILRNEVAHNAGGILSSDETGPTMHNLISENYVHDNVYDCGITLASHAPATAIIPAATLSYGVGYNTISRNASIGNGTQTPGAGVGIFAPSPGTTATGNVVINNIIWNNGATGVAMHNHAAPPSPAPPINFNDNTIVGNDFSGNGPDNPGAPTPGPTAINIFSMAAITGTVVEQNTFEHESIDVGFTAPAGQLNVHFNNFSSGIAIDNFGAAPVDATENWWNCAAGANGRHCATVQGSGVSFTPWLLAPVSGLDDLLGPTGRY
ncbi:MAG TPA: right-handed parallel beta-helix repeat-containing protein [Acidobacteriaceae bacterium]|jgi:nitrous oxidase accessory protein NosD|nr:right-handed parallel beta-helix repeat-containing protein [Acidobacteriaceae bacterium]